MKTETLNIPDASNVKYPRLGRGTATGHMYVQTSKHSRWISLQVADVTEPYTSVMVEPLPVGTTVKLTQE